MLIIIMPNDDHNQFYQFLFQVEVDLINYKISFSHHCHKIKLNLITIFKTYSNSPLAVGIMVTHYRQA